MHYTDKAILTYCERFQESGILMWDCHYFYPKFNILKELYSKFPDISFYMLPNHTTNSMSNYKESKSLQLVNPNLVNLWNPKQQQNLRYCKKSKFFELAFYTTNFVL